MRSLQEIINEIISKRQPEDPVRAAKKAMTVAPEPKKLGPLDEFIGGVKRVPGNIAASGLAFAGQVLEDPELKEASKRARQQALEESPSTISDKPITEMDASEVAAFAAGSIPDVVSSAGLAVIGGGPVRQAVAKAVPAIRYAIPQTAKALARLGGRSAIADVVGTTAGALPLELGSIGQDVYEKTGEAVPTGKILAPAALAASLEALSASGLLRTARRLMGTTVADAALRAGGDDGIKGAIKNWFKTSTKEGITEGLQTIAEETGQDTAAGESFIPALARRATDPETLQNALKAGVAGFAGGAGMGAPDFAMDLARRGQEAKPAQAQEQPPAQPIPQQPVSQPTVPPGPPEPPPKISRKQAYNLRVLLNQAGLSPDSHDEYIADRMGRPVKMADLDVNEGSSILDDITEMVSTGKSIRDVWAEKRTAAAQMPMGATAQGNIQVPEMQPVQRPMAPTDSGLAMAIEQAKAATVQAPPPTIAPVGRVVMPLAPQIRNQPGQVQAPPMQPVQRPIQQPAMAPLPPAPMAPPRNLEQAVQRAKMPMPEHGKPRGMEATMPEQVKADMAKITFPDTPQGQAAARAEPDTRKLILASNAQVGGGSTSLRQEIAERYSALPNDIKAGLSFPEWKAAVVEGREPKTESPPDAAKAPTQPAPSTSSTKTPETMFPKGTPQNPEETFPATQAEMAADLERGAKVRHGSRQYQVVQNKQGGWAIKEWDDALPGIVTTTGVVVPSRTPGSSKAQAINNVLRFWHSDNARPEVQGGAPQEPHQKPETAPATPNQAESKPAPEQEKAPTPSGNKLVTDARYAELVKKMKGKLGQLSAGFDPEFFTIGVEMAVYQIESGARKFAAYSKAMVETFGEKIRPYLKSFYAGARNFPGLSTEGMESDQEIEAQAKSVDTKPSAGEVQKEDVGIPGAVKIPALTRALVTFIDSNFKPGAEATRNDILKKYVAGLFGITHAELMADPKYNHKITQEAFEGALVLWIRKNNPDQKTLNELYRWQPPLSERTGESSANQAYSTPVNLVGYITDALNLKGDESVFEPTAGNGLLVSSVRGDGNMILNEIDKTRLEILKEGFPKASITTINALEKPTVRGVCAVVMANPPFGSLDQPMQAETTGDKVVKFGLKGLEHAIAWNALETMKDDGKAVLILGAEKEPGFRGRNAAFNNMLYNQYNVVSHFETDGKLYHRQGADWPIQVIVIHGRRNFQGVKITPPTAVERLDSWDAVAAETKRVKEKIDADYDGNRLRMPATVRPEGEGSNLGTGGKPDQGGAEPGGPETGQQGPPQRGPVAQAGRPSEPAVKPEKPARVPAEKRKPAEPERKLPDEKRGDQFAPSRPGATESVGPDSTAGVDVVGSELQAKYEAGSKVGGQGFLVPKYLKNSMEQAIKRLEEREKKTIDAFVADELGMTPQQLKGSFFAPQIDAIGLAIAAAKNGQAIVNADQTGVGKGRTAAAMIVWAKKNGMTPVFFTEKPTLFSDMYRDLKGIGHPEIKPFIMNSDGVITETDKTTGKVTTIFKPGDSVVDDFPATLAAMQVGKVPEGFDAVFCTYSQISGADRVKGRETLSLKKRQALNGLKNTFVILDEAHNAGGDIEASRTAEYMAGLIDESKAKSVYYLSATWAKRPENMNIFYRAIGGDPQTLQAAFDSGGAGMQEMMVTGLTTNGKYVRREQDYSTVSFKTNMTTEENAEKEREQSDAFMQGIRKVAEFAKEFTDMVQAEDEGQKPKVDISDLVPEDFELSNGAVDWATADFSRADIFSGLFNLVEQVTASLKADRAADRAIEMVKKGQKPVIALRNTMESLIEDLKDDGGEFDGTLADLIRRKLTNASSFVVESQIPDDKGNRRKFRLRIPYDRLPQELKELYSAAESEIMAATEILEGLPFSPIDHIRAKLERNGIRVAEITGRQAYLDYNDTDDQGRPRYKTRPKLTPKKRNDALSSFNNGTADALLINEAGSTGLSAHSGEGYDDQRQRAMLIVQPLLDVNDFMQILGRIFRSGSVTDPAKVTGKAPKVQGLPEAYGPPYYEYLQTRSYMEQRPASMQQNKVKSLNAQVSSNQEGHQKIETVDIYNKYGDRIAYAWLEANPEVADIIGYGDKIANDEKVSADDIVKRLAITTVDTQARFWQEVVPEYKDEIAYLDMMGMNDLVPVSMKDANAKTITRNEVLPAADSSSSPVYLENLEVTIPGNPITLAGAFEGAKEVDKTDLEKADDRFEKHMETVKKRNEESRAEGKKTLLSEAMIRDNADRVKRAITTGTLKPGSMILFAPGGILPDETFVPAVVREIKIGDQVNPFSPSNIKVVLNSPTANGTMVFSLQKLEEARYRSVEKGLFESEWPGFEKAFKTKTDNRYFLTGDVLRATGVYTGQAQVVRFSRNDGTSEFGWLLPEGFRPQAGTLKAPGKTISPESAGAFVESEVSEENPIATRDGKTLVMYKYAGSWNIEVMNTSAGKKITTDETIAKMFAAQGSPWAQSHGKVFTIRGMGRSNAAKVLSRAAEILRGEGISIYAPKEDVVPSAPMLGRSGSIGGRGGYGPGQALDRLMKQGYGKAIEMAQKFVAAGRSFAEYVASAVDRFGTRIRLKLAEIWKAVRVPSPSSRRGARASVSSLLSGKPKSVGEAVKKVQAPKPSDRVTKAPEIARKMAEKTKPSTAFKIGVEAGQEKERAIAEEAIKFERAELGKEVSGLKASLRAARETIEKNQGVTAEVRKALIGYAMRMPRDVRAGFIARVAQARTADAGLEIISDMTTSARRGDLRKALRLLRDVSKKAKDGMKLRPEFKAMAQKILAKAEEMIDKVKRKGGFDKLIEESAIMLSEFVENEMKDGEMAPVHMQAINDLIAGIRKDAAKKRAQPTPGKKKRSSEKTFELEPSLAAAAHARALVNIYRMIERANQIENQIIQGKNLKNINSITEPAVKFIEKNETITQVEGEDSENGFVRRFFDEGMLSFEAIAERLGPAKKLFYDDLNSGYESALGLYNEIMDPLKAMMKKIDMDPDSQKTASFLEEKVNVAGAKITRGERMEFVCHLLDSSTRREIIKAGAVLRRNQDGDKITITEEQADEIIGSLSANERKIVDAMFSSLGGKLRRAINKTWVFLAGYEKALRNDYFPRSRKGESTGMNAFQRSAVGPMLEGLDIFKERTGSTTKPVIIGDVMTTFHRHVIKAAMFAEMAIPIRNVKIAMGAGGVGPAVRKHYGKQFETRIENQVKAMAEMGKFEEGIANQIVSAVTRNIGTHYLGFGIRSMLKQFGGLFTMMAEANLGDIGKALVRGGISPTDALRGIAGKELTDEITKLIFKYSPKLRDRYDSHGEKLLSPTFGFQNSLLSASSGKMQDLWRMMKEFSMRGLTSFDRQITRVAWMVAEEEATRNGFSKSNVEEFYKAVAKRAEQIVSRTQNSTSVVDMSGIALEARTNALVKAGIAFQSQGNAVYNIARRAVFEFSQGKIGIAGLAYKLAVANVGNALFSALVVSMTRGGGEDEEKKKRRKEASKIVDLTWEVFNENANSIYFGSMFRPVIMAAKSAVSDQPISQTKIKTENVAQKVVNDSLNSIVSLIKAIAADGDKFKTGKRKGKLKSEEYAKEAADSAVNSMAALAGLPRPIVKGGQLIYNLSGGK